MTSKSSSIQTFLFPFLLLSLAIVALGWLLSSGEHQPLAATGGNPANLPGVSSNPADFKEAGSTPAPSLESTFSENAGTSSLPPPKIVSVPLSQAVVGQLYEYDVDGSSVPGGRFSLEKAPEGMEINSSSGLITWSQPIFGRFEVTVRAENPAGADRQNFTLSVAEVLLDQCIPAKTTEPVVTVTPPTPSPTAGENEVFTYRVYQLDLAARSPGVKPYADGPSVSATFSGESGEAAGRQVVVHGFWDGERSWKIRFAPTATGEWSYMTASSDPGLDGKSGRLTAVAPAAEQIADNPLYRGFLEPDGFAWKLSDGSPFLPVGDTQWSFAEETTLSEWQRWMDARQAQGFNSFLGTVWLAIYDRPEATGPPFPDKDPKSDDLQVAYFQRLDQMVQYANDHGIQVGLSIGGFPGNSDWFKLFGSREQNDRWFQYVVARYAAYNVRWLLYGEVNEANTPWQTTWQEEVLHSAQLVHAADPYDHPIGSHHSRFDTSSASSPYIDYIEAQVERTAVQYLEALEYRRFGKPLWFEEFWYESPEYDNEVALGIRNAHRNFIAALAFPTMGSLMRSHYPNFDVEQVETDPGALRMCYFAKYYAGLDYSHFTPVSNFADRGQAGQFGDDYTVFLQSGGRATLDLTQINGIFSVRILDINSGLISPAGNITGGGKRIIDSGTDQDIAILLLKTE